MLFSRGERERMESEGEKDSDRLKKLAKREGKPRSVMSKRLDAGKTIQLDLSTKAQLLTIISRTEGLDTLNHSLIIEENHKLRIVLIADPYAPHVLMYVSTVENP